MFIAIEYLLPMKVLLVHPSAGDSGDMIMASLLDLGADLQSVRQADRARGLPPGEEEQLGPQVHLRHHTIRAQAINIYNDYIVSLPLHAIKGGGRAVGLTHPIVL